MTKTRKRYLLALILLILGVGASYGWNALPNPRRWERGFSQIEVGDTREKLLEVVGKPSEKKDCHCARYSGNPTLWQKCGEEYWYIAFMQEWVYVIGQDGNVIAKAHSVSH